MIYNIHINKTIALFSQNILFVCTLDTVPSTVWQPPESPHSTVNPFRHGYSAVYQVPTPTQCLSKCSNPFFALFVFIAYPRVMLSHCLPSFFVIPFHGTESVTRVSLAPPPLLASHPITTHWYLIPWYLLLPLHHTPLPLPGICYHRISCPPCITHHYHTLVFDTIVSLAPPASHPITTHWYLLLSYLLPSLHHTPLPPTGT